MIDYEKLKEAHELASQSGIYYFNMAFGMGNTRGAILIYRVGEFHAHSLIMDGDIDRLIARLKELTQPKPKYKVGDEIWWLNGRGVILNANVTEILASRTNEQSLQYSTDNRWTLREEEIYPSKEALIKVHPRPKYKVGDECWWIRRHNNPPLCCIVIKAEYLSPPINYGGWSYYVEIEDGGYTWMHEDDLHPTIQALIEAQIKYWNEQLYPILKHVDENGKLETGEFKEPEIPCETRHCEKCEKDYIVFTDYAGEDNGLCYKCDPFGCCQKCYEPLSCCDCMEETKCEKEANCKHSWKQGTYMPYQPERHPCEKCGEIFDVPWAPPEAWDLSKVDNFLCIGKNSTFICSAGCPACKERRERRDP